MTGLVRLFSAALCVAAVLTAGTAVADDEGAIKYRQAVMKAVGGHMSAMAAILQGRVPFTDNLKGHARAQAELARISGKVFPEGSDFGETRAKADIWAKPAEFEKAIAAFQTETAALAKVAESGDMGAFGGQFRKVGGTCKGCHDAFRAPEKE